VFPRAHNRFAGTILGVCIVKRYKHVNQPRRGWAAALRASKIINPQRIIRMYRNVSPAGVR